MLNYLVKRHISRRKLLKNLKQKPEWKDLTRTPSINIAISQHKTKWDQIDNETFQPLSDSIKNEPSKYKHLFVKKKDLNKKIKDNYKKMVDLTSDVMVVKEAPLVSSNADIVNKLNSMEVKRFKKSYFIKETTKQILERERSLGYNYINTNDVIIDKELSKNLQRVNDLSYDNSEFVNYIETINALKNSKIDDMLYLNENQDKKISKYLLGSSEQPIKNKESETIEVLDDGINTAGFLVQTKMHMESEDRDNGLIELSKEDYERCRSIITFENESFQSNRDIFAPKNRFSELSYDAKLFYLKQRVNTVDDVLEMGHFYINNNMLPEMMLPFYKRIAEITIHAHNYYENPEYVDLITISKSNYKTLLKSSLRGLSAYSFDELANFYQSFMNLHKREEGKILGRIYEKINYALVKKFIYTITTERDTVINQPFQLSLVLESIQELKKSYSFIIKNKTALTELVKILKEIKIDGAVENMSLNTRIFNFLSQAYMDNPDNKDLDSLVKRFELIFEQNLDNMLNPSNFDCFFENLCKIAPLMTNTQILTLNIRLKNHVLPRIKENISLANLSTLSTYLSKFSSPDFQIYHFIRKNTFTLFNESNTINVTDVLRLLNNSGYIEVLNAYKDFFMNSDQTSLIITFYFKHIFNL